MAALPRKQHRFLLAAPASGSGKTTAASVLLAALRDRGLSVQPYKAGPDYLDPTHLSHAAGVPARNLDSFLLPPDTLRRSFARSGQGRDVQLVEGLMGLYDGRSADSDEHSSAALARLLDLPVVLLLDAGGMARTAAAVALGLKTFGPDLRFAGAVLNRVGSDRHAALCASALAQVGLPTFGFIPKRPGLALPARHLGLLAAEQHAHDRPALLEAARTMDLDALLAATEVPAPARPLPDDGADVLPGPPVRLALARDEAFSFYYPDALEALEAAGAVLVPFSPLSGSEVPPADGLLLGGGYPEAHAQALSANAAMRASVRAFAASGRPVLAECGGLMYLSEELSDLQGQVFPMCAAVPYRTRMTGRLTLGYRDAALVADGPLAPAGTRVRAHEFHYSALVGEATRPAYQLAGGPEGYARGNVLASYLHLHLGAYPQLVRRFLDTCLAERR